ncbi:MAG: tRNA uridine-5-carboxymethylaminomethyl(34) synthesis GTPase MnmE [Sphingopyxis terrae]|uniref:tRNA uridine-5-carboxymethylaminomethyl(34) synthesis GTPase MnmE n=1 Tax=uncultured Sphingopyxis sp. TaxID=310581 RepID=UPI001AC069B7|nr:tRNA uridine-5-carboxymethylaminomethyl(34) synthesis GTPase MnmE [uncultured Sphingopyxis sp.]MBN8805020.1 tRNA uridine-5-carboxymethylaminomethyl(34) synthesis GTPase MnmE [Sphingopyxis terrae]
MASETIFALSSGMPPAAIAVVRVSGAHAADAVRALAGRLPPPRHASLADLTDTTGAPLDRALILWFPGPNTATGEDLAEFHLHGGRAVVAAVEAALTALPGLRRAEAGEFTRRAFLNGRIDLAEAEGLADLLAAETESQRVQALGLASGHVSRAVAAWQERLLALMAAAEAELNFADEDDVDVYEGAAARLVAGMAALAAELGEWLARPAAEVIAEGLSVVIAGPPNAGKSTLINALAQRELAIVSPVAGTTRDIIETPLALDGIAMRFSDTAGLRGEGADVVEAIGIDRARAAVEAADIVLWLGPPRDAPDHPRCILIAAQADHWRGDAAAEADAARCDLILSAATGEGMEALHGMIVDMARTLLPREGEAALRQRQRAALAEAQQWLGIDPGSREAGDLILIAERLRLAAGVLDRITGRAGVEDMLDALFGRFCIGK